MTHKDHSEPNRRVHRWLVSGRLLMITKWWHETACIGAIDPNERPGRIPLSISFYKTIFVEILQLPSGWLRPNRYRTSPTPREWKLGTWTLLTERPLERPHRLIEGAFPARRPIPIVSTPPQPWVIPQMMEDVSTMRLVLLHYFFLVSLNEFLISYFCADYQRHIPGWLP